MHASFSTKVIKGNNQGTGIIYFPQKKASLFPVRRWVEVIPAGSREKQFYARVIHDRGRKGVYVPKRIAQHLPQETLEYIVERQNGFHAPIAQDGTIYIPRDVVNRHSLQSNDIVLLTLAEKGVEPVSFYRKIYVLRREKRGSCEYIVRLPRTFSKRSAVFTLEKLPNKANVGAPLLQGLTRGMHHAFTTDGSLVLFRGNKIPALANPYLRYEGIARYLGAYFSDGTKLGNSWAIVASNFLQASWYVKSHRELIRDASPRYVLVYTHYGRNSQSLSRKLREKWETTIGQEIQEVRALQAVGQRKSKWSPFGSLVIREDRQILLDIYANLLTAFSEHLYRTQDKQLAWEFFYGVLEGDGGTPATKRGHILIATNDKEHWAIEKVLEVLGLQFKTIREGEHKYLIRVGALELLRNFSTLEPNIFSYYPKRRAVFFERFNTVGAVRFFTEGHTPTSWVKAWLRDNGFVDRKYNLTSKGIELQKFLLRAAELAVNP